MDQNKAETGIADDGADVSPEMPASTDPVFQEEQRHLSATYAKLQRIEAETAEKLRDISAEASRDIANMRDEMAIDLADDSQALETWAEFELMNTLIDAYNLANDVNKEKLARIYTLLRQPYFAKVRLQFKPGAEPKEVYIGAAGMTDENRSHFIVDWRSPVAEVYYNQANGRTSYEADGRTIECDMLLRRQFDISRDMLNAYFDTTVAIEDPLLLASLSRRRSDRMQSITATIQKEQNQVIRHADVPVLLVNGIAGSGKTSVLLQRIAYLLYRFRDDMNPNNVCLITPNPVFQRYISNVLPELGERNPKTCTFRELMERLGMGERAQDVAGDAASLRALDDGLRTLVLEPDDFCDITVEGRRVFPAAQVRRIAGSFSRIAPGPRLVALVAEELRERLDAKVKSLEKADVTHAEIMDMPESEQMELFGHRVFPQSDEEFVELSRIMLARRFAPVYAGLEDASWLRIDRIGMRITGNDHLSAPEWVYLKLALTGNCDRDVRFVMVDEVQDYNTAQLMMLSRCFPNAHFLLLGDENQAVEPGTASFAEIRELFKATHGCVEECRLTTSYRSTPEITRLFASLLDEDARIEISSVQRPGTDPVVVECPDEAAYAQELRRAVADASAYVEREGGLAAVIAPTRKRAKKIAAMLADAPSPAAGGPDATAAVSVVGSASGSASVPSPASASGSGSVPVLLTGDAPLPESGVVVLSLKLAKGLEFDRAIVVDADSVFFPESLLSRRRLYVAISRATKHVTVLARGALSPCLKGADA